MRLLRTKTKLFASFFRSNRQSTCNKFIVTGFDIGSSAEEEGKVGGTVVLYRHGTLAQEDFEPPSQPGKPQCDVIDHSTVNVSWSPPDKGVDGVQGYIVKYKRFRGKNQSGDILDEVRTEKGDTCCTVRNLEPDEVLRFQITAVCSVGVSPDSESSDRVTTLPASPPGKPEARPASASSIALEWEHPAQSGKHVTIRSYFIKFGKVVNGAVPNWQPEVGTGSSEGRFTVRKLETNVSYVFQVVAIYEPWATSLPSTNSDVCATLPVSQPGKPELGDVTASSVEMKWTSPTKIGPGVKLKEYFIKYAEVEEQQSQIPEWKWKQVWTYSLHEEYKLSGLLPNRTYISRVVLVLEDDYITQSEPSVPFTTLPAGPPTDVTVEQTSATDIKVSWSKPTLISQQKAIKHYRIDYQIVGVTNNVEQKEVNTSDDSLTSTIKDATPETKFKIWVTAVCGEEDKLGESSKVVSFTTKKFLKHEIKVNAKTLQPGNKKNGKPCILKFPLKEVCRRPYCQSFSFGEPPKMQGVEHKVIMVVGVTGSGKSTLINAMANHILDVDRKDDFRFKMVDVDEARGSSQAHSQTQIITSYTIYRNNYLSLPYTLTIIDTPGFGDTHGIERDKAIKGHIEQFFLDAESHGIDHIDAIGFVVKASDSRLTTTHMFLFDSLLSVFGKDISDNIFLLVTFADEGEPPVFDAVQAFISYVDTDSAFKFNNSALFVGYDTDRKGSKKKAGKAAKVKMVDVFWKMGKENMTDFLLEIQTLEPRSLVLTKEVLEERKRLEVMVHGLQPQINLGICKLAELQWEHQLLQQHEKDIEANKDFKFELEVPKSKMVEITGEFITNCSKCHFTCHYPCGIADDKKKDRCSAMKDGVCTVCPGKCAWNVHFNQPYRFEFFKEKERRTYGEIEAMYKDASGKKMTVEQVIKKQVEEVKAVRACVCKLVSDTRQSIMRLEEIALKPNPLSIPEYIDVLIESEKSSHKKGWQTRINALQGVRKEEEMLDKVKDENYNPFENYSNTFQPAGKDNKSRWFGRFLSSWMS
ncbi:uncharacterized protein LOC119744989 [Patiria miniata]|uniref:Fibronectin type-III domain-containing protein n=1 Tax=Patiria miniata TaxID=46514 RepID=A0A914BNS5_PATMI|nr:uncharacterized protein LOC119744989 [Patiria miniata]